MGQNQSQQPLEQQYNIMNVLEDGSAILQNKKTDSECLLRNVCSNVEDQISGFSQLLKQRETIKSPHLLQLIQIRKKEEKQVCSIVHKLYMLIEYPFKTLKDQIQEKKSAGYIRNSQAPGRVPKQMFTQEQLWSILYSCCVGLECLYEHKLSHEALSTSEIYIDKDGIIKISDPVLLGLQKNYIKVLKKDQKRAYVSPEIMNFLDDCNFSFFDKEKSDIFTLGVIMLELCLLEEIDIYDSQIKQPNLERIPVYLNKMRSFYSDRFYNLVASMLQIIAKMRPSFTQIISIIQSFQESSSTNNSFSNLKNMNMSTPYNSQGYPQNRTIQYTPQIQPKNSLQAHTQNRMSYMQNNMINNGLNQNNFLNHWHQENNSQPPSVSFPKPSHSSEHHSTTFRGNEPVNIPQNNMYFIHQQNYPQPNKPLFSDQIPEISQLLKNSAKNKESIRIVQPKKPLPNLNNFIPYSPPTHYQTVNNCENLPRKPDSPFSNIHLQRPHNSNNLSKTLPTQNIKVQDKYQFLEPEKKKTIKINSPQKSPGADEKQPDMKNQAGEQQTKQSYYNKNNKREYVTLLLNHGGRYNGYYENGMRNGQGKLEFKDGGYYIGQWKDDRMHGYGRLYYQNGNIAYQGQFVNDEFEGVGQVYNNEPEKILGSFNYHDFADLGNRWIYYQGQLKKDSKHGKGLIKLSNGQTFEGNFIYDVIEGDGNFYKSSGQIIRGRWQDNILIKK